MLKGAASAAPFSIRAVAASDIPAITAIYAEAVRTGTASFELEPPGETEMEQRRRGLVEGGFPYLVAVSDGGLLGYAYAGLYRTRPAYGWTLEDSIYVAPAAQGRRIGRALLEAIIEELADAGFRQMIAVIGDFANQASIRLHELLGFTYIGNHTNVGWKHGRWLDTVLMQLPLGPGADTPPGR